MLHYASLDGWHGCVSRVQVAGIHGRHGRATQGTIGLLSFLLLLCAGCAQQHGTVVDAFPPAAAATPWILQDAVWSGTFDEAASALGDAAEAWAKHNLTWVWLAKYRHESHAEYCLTVRCFAFESPAEAHAAFDSYRPVGAKSFRVGDAGCWTEFGVMFQWGRVVFDIFGDEASWNNELQAALLAGCIEQRMPPGVPENPR